MSIRGATLKTRELKQVLAADFEAAIIKVWTRTDDPEEYRSVVVLDDEEHLTPVEGLLSDKFGGQLRLITRAENEIALIIFWAYPEAG